MPSPQDALNYAKRFCGNLPVDDPNIIYRILDDANKALWMASPWRWTIAPLENVQLQNNTQDYTLASHPDLLVLFQSAITDGEQKSELTITASLPAANAIVGKSKRIAYIPGSPQKVRFAPTPSGYPASAMPTVITWYKQLAPLVNAGNYTTDYNTLTQTVGGGGGVLNVGIPQEWFWVYEEMVLLKAYQFTHDARLGGVAVDRSKDPKTGNEVVAIKYSGQYAVIEDALVKMRLAEEQFFDSLGTEVMH
jgi:hypothetical protein